MNASTNSRAFWKAIVAGSLVGGLGTVGSQLAQFLFASGAASTLWESKIDGFIFAAGLVLVSVAIAFCVVFLSSVLIGLPVYFLLRKVRRESRILYGATGATVGFSLAALADFRWSVHPNVLAFSVIAGVVTGWIWGAERAKILRESGSDYSPLI